MRSLPYWRLSAFYFFYFALVGAMAPFWGLYLKSLRLGPLEIAVLMSLLQITRIFAPNAWGWLADRRGERSGIIRMVVLASALTYLGVFLGASFAWLFCVMGLMSFFWTGSLPLVDATTLSHLRERSDRYGRIRLWGSLGFIGSVLGLGYLLDRMPVAILPWAVAGLMAGLVVASQNVPEAPVLPHDTDRLSVWHIVRRKEVAALMAACFLMAAAHGPYYTFYSIYLAGHGYSKSDIGALWALGVVCEIGIFLLSPRLFARFSAESILLFSFMAAVVRFLLIAFSVDHPVALIFAQTLHAFTFGAYHAAAMVLIHRYFKGRHQAKGQGLYNSFAFGAGGAVGGLVSGYTWGGLGPSATYCLSAAAAALGMLVLWSAGRRAVRGLSLSTAQEGPLG